MSSLFTPYKLGPVTLRNRTVRSAAFESMGRHFGPTEQLKEYHVSVARGGVGMTTLAYAAVIEPIARFVATVSFAYAGPFPVIDTDLTMQVLLGLLGLGAYRSVEKIKGVARQ